MEISAARLIEGVKEIFPECGELDLSVDSILADVPEWDSMAAVNLQTFLLQKYQIEVPLELLADDTSLQEIMAFLEESSLHEEAC